MASAADLRRQLAGLTHLAGVDLTKIWRQLDSAAFTGEALHDLLPALIAEYGSAAAAITADWYDDLRMAVTLRSRFAAIPAEIKDDGAEALVGWATSQTKDPVVLQQLIRGGMTRRILNYSRQTVMGSSVADPGAGGWRRVGDGSSCAFCSMLIDRGDVYSESSVDFASHDHCGCGAAPAWKDERVRGVLLDENGKRLTQSSRKTRTDDKQRAADNERISAWIASHPSAG